MNTSIDLMNHTLKSLRRNGSVITNKSFNTRMSLARPSILDDTLIELDSC